MYPFIAVGQWRFGTYGICLLTGLFVGYALFRVELRRRPLPSVQAQEVMAVMAIGAILGAKLLWFLENLGHRPVVTPLTDGGSSYYGALIVDCLAALWLARRYRVPVLRLSDTLAVPCAVAYGIARLGCFFSGDGDYGIATSLPWGMSFPDGLVPTTQRVHPAPLYELLSSAAIACALWQLGSPARRARAPIGELSALFLIWTGIARVLVEIIKRNPRLLWGLADSQLIGLISILIGFALLHRCRSLAPQLEATL